MFLKFIESFNRAGRFIYGMLMIGISADTYQMSSAANSMEGLDEFIKMSQEPSTNTSFLTRWGLYPTQQTKESNFKVMQPLPSESYTLRK